MICSYVLYPVSLFMGTELGLDCRRMGELVGVKTFTNEFIAYKRLKVLLDNRNVFKNYSMFYDVTNSSNVAYNDMDVHLTQWNVVLEKGFLSVSQEQFNLLDACLLCG